MNKYVMELVGTFFLVFTVGCTVVSPGAGALAPLAIGPVLMVMVFAGGHISGAHYNPAITLGVWMRGKCPTKDVAPYMIFQIVGALLAALAVKYLKAGTVVTPMNLAIGPAFLAEFLFTFALVFVVLNTATAKDTAGNSFYGLAIGFTVLAGAFAVGNISGGAFNPGVAIGISLMGLAAWPSIWIYLVAEFLGGAVAALVFEAVSPADHEARSLLFSSARPR
jgi:aquaporin Z